MDPVQIVKELLLSNGLKFSITDQSRRYFGDYHDLKILISCNIPLDLLPFPDEKERIHAENVLGSALTYRRLLRKMAVPSKEMDQALRELISPFETNSLPYFNSPKFLRKLLQSELDKFQKKMPLSKK